MSFDLDELMHAVAQHSDVVRVVVTSVKGSAPRDTGTAMLVWQGGQSGTIGGGALELDAAAYARKSIDQQIPHAGKTYALGPEVGQCCGGSVTLLFQWFRADRMPTEFPVATPVMSNATIPAAVRQLVNKGVARSVAAEGWFIEPLARPTRQLWLFGAGHVGRAVVSVISALPELEITWVDTAPDRFPADIPANTRSLAAANPADVVRYAPPEAEHLVMTYSHKFDLDLCHALLGHGFNYAGLIGSATKWARFRKRLRDLGHDAASIDRIACPIGQPAYGKHPQAIAVGVAAELLSRGTAMHSQQERRA